MHIYISKGSQISKFHLDSLNNVEGVWDPNFYQPTQLLSDDSSIIKPEVWLYLYSWPTNRRTTPVYSIINT